MAFIPVNQIFINNLLNEVAAEQENHRDRIFYEKRDPFDDLSERMFIKQFRLSKVAAQHLIEIVAEHIPEPARQSALCHKTMVNEKIKS